MANYQSSWCNWNTVVSMCCPPCSTFFFFNRQECILFNVMLRSCKVVTATLKLCCILIFHCNCHLYAYILQNFMMFLSKDIRDKCIASLGINIYVLCPCSYVDAFLFYMQTQTCTHRNSQVHTNPGALAGKKTSQ